MGLAGLEFHPVDVKFNEGLDTRTQSKLVLPSKWVQLNNVTLTQDSTPRLRDAYSTANVAAVGNGLAVHGGECLVINETAASSISLTNGSAAIPVPGEVGCVGLSKTEVVRASAMLEAADVAYGNGYTCYVWRRLTATGTFVDLRMTLVDETTGTIFQNQVQFGTDDSGPRVVFANNAFFILWRAAGGAMNGRVVETSAPTVLGALTVLLGAGSIAGVAYIDACAVGAFVGVVYPNGGGSASVFSAGISRAGNVPLTVLGPTAVVTEAQLPIASLTGVAIGLYLGASTVGVFATGITGTLAGTVAASLDVTSWASFGNARVDTTVGPAAASVHVAVVPDASSVTMHVFVDQVSALNPTTNRVNPLRYLVVSAGLAVSVGPTTIVNSFSYRINAAEPSGLRGPWIAGKPFLSQSGKPYLPCYMTENYQNLGSNTRTASAQAMFLVLDGTTGVVVSRALYGNPTSLGVASVNNVAAGVWAPCSTPAVAANRFAIALQERSRTVQSQGLNVSPMGLCRLTLAPNTTSAAIKLQLGDSTYLAGGSLTTYDGNGLIEASFHAYPEGISVVQTATGGSMTAGVHQVVAVYEWLDAQGQRHQSSPCLAVSSPSISLNDRLTVLIPTTTLSQKPNLNIAVYCTLAGGLTFYRCNLNNGTFGTLANSTAATSVTFIITESDASLVANELLYTQPNLSTGELPNDAPPPCNWMSSHQTRIFCDVADAPNQFRFSQQLIQGTGLQWSDSLGGTVDVNGGGITGFAELDEKVVILTGRRLYAVFGTGPNPAGGYSNYSDPTEIASDVGCIDGRSILRMPMGIVFKAVKGWHLLGRDLTVRYIGEGVNVYDGVSVNAAVLLDDRKECRFPLANGVTLVWSYLYDAWETFQSGSYVGVDAVWWPARYAVNGNGYVHVSKTVGFTIEGSSTPNDVINGVTTFISRTQRTSFLKVNSIAGFQRVRKLYLTASSGTSPQTTLSIRVDFDDAQSGGQGSYSFTVDLSRINFASNQAIDIEHKLQHQKCKSVAFTITETDPKNSGKALTGFQALGLQVGSKRGANKLPAAQNVG